MSQEKEAGGGAPNDYQKVVTECTWMVMDAIARGEPLRTAITRVIGYVRACDREDRALKAKDQP
jgi:hypothetical protein